MPAPARDAEGGDFELGEQSFAQPLTQEAAQRGGDADATRGTGGAAAGVQIVRRGMSFMATRGDELRGYSTFWGKVQRLFPPGFKMLCLVCVALGVGFEWFKPVFSSSASGTKCTATKDGKSICESKNEITPIKNFTDGERDCTIGMTKAQLMTHGLTKCPLVSTSFKTPLPTWRAYLVISTIVLVIGSIIMGGPAATLMMAGNAVFVVAGVVTEQEALEGFGNKGIFALAVLFILSYAVERSGMLEPVVASLLGEGGSESVARVRLMVPVAVLSGFMNNTPLCSMLLPVVISWAQKQGLDPFQFLMPLAYASSIGGAFSKIGSPANLVAGDYTFNPRLKFGMGFFDLTPVATLLIATTVLYTFVSAPFLLRASIRPASKETRGKEDAELYTSSWLVCADSELVGLTWRGRGLHRFPNTKLLRVDAPAPRDTSGAGEDSRFCVGDEVWIASDAEGIAKLRRVRGLIISGGAGDGLRMLGSGRRERCLFEGLLHAAGSARSAARPAGAATPELRRYLLQERRAALIAVRGEAAAASDTATASSELAPDGGRLVLMEAQSASFESGAVADFALVRKVPGSSPPRIGRKADPMRARFTLAMTLLVVVLTSLQFENLPLGMLTVIAILFLLVMDILTVDEALNAINVNCFLVSAAAMGIGKAMDKSGVAQGFAELLVYMAKGTGYGTPAICVALISATSFLSNLISNTATAVLMMPIAENIALNEGTNLKMLVLLVIYGANCPFSTPFATPANTMVMQPSGPDDAGYSFMDYMKFGVILQFLCVIVAVPATIYLWNDDGVLTQMGW